MTRTLITLQLPIFDERYIVESLPDAVAPDAVARIEYPRHLLEARVPRVAGTMGRDHRVEGEG